MRKSMSSSVLPPLKSVAYLVVLREQNSQILNEFAASYESLRRFHPDLQVMVYHHHLMSSEIDYFNGLKNVMCFPIGIDCSGRFEENRYLELHGWSFPELYVLAAKIDVLLMTPGDTLFLDTDTEVLASLDECLDSDQPWMHKSEGRFVDHERDFSSLLDSVHWSTFGWKGDLEKLTVYNSGSIYVPQSFKHCLYGAKELLWAMAQLPGKDRGDNRLDEQLAVSVALQEAVDYQLQEIAPRVYHYRLEKYDKVGDWYHRVHGPESCSPVIEEVLSYYPRGLR